MPGSGLPFDKRHRGSPKSADFSDMLESYLPGTDDLDRKHKGERHQVQNQTPDKIPVQARIDLHGLTLEAARKAVDAFLKESKGRGLRKVLIIYGKGLHSGGGESVLKKGIQSYLEGHVLAGRRQTASGQDGGNGALYVFIKTAKN